MDDDPSFTELTAEFLEREHDWIEVASETHVGDALDLIETTGDSFDCIVSDYEMPTLDGLEFLDAVRQHHDELPFILFTGKGSEEIASKAISAGVTDYLQKSVGADQYTVLANRIENAVSSYRTSNELAATRRQFQELVEQNLVGIYIIQDCQFVHANPRLAAIHGYDQDDVIGRSPLDLIAPEERDRVQENMRQRLDGEVDTVHYRTVGLRKDGERIDIELHGSSIEYEGSPAIIGVELDITERKQREREYARFKERFQVYVEHASDIITVLDDSGGIQYTSPSIEHVLGYEAEEVTGTNVADYLHPDDRERVLTQFFELIDHPVTATETVEFRFAHADGTWVWLESIGSNQKHTAVDGYVVNSRDITERKRREHELEQQNDRLQNFAGIVSHDLRNPLNVAQTRLELACRTDEEIHLEKVERAHNRMERIIDDLLWLAQEGREIGETKSVPLARIVNDAWSHVNTAEGTLSVTTDHTINADPDRLQQLFENLFRNAIDHGGTDVSIRVGLVEDGFYVEDDGPGIPASDRDRVLEPGFSRTDEGTGFGLSIVQTIVDAHGWQLIVTDGSAHGARFEVVGVDSTEP